MTTSSTTWFTASSLAKLKHSVTVFARYLRSSYRRGDYYERDLIVSSRSEKIELIPYFILPALRYHPREPFFLNGNIGTPRKNSGSNKPCVNEGHIEVRRSTILLEILSEGVKPAPKVTVFFRFFNIPL